MTSRAPRTRLLSPLLAGALIATSLSAVAPVAAAAQTTDRLVLSEGHLDAFDVIRDGDDALALQMKDDTFLHADQIVYRDPSDVLMHTRVPGSEITVPGGDQWAFLGEAGSTVYNLPQTQDPDLLWPGWSTERLGGGFAGQITLELVDIEGPGDLKLFQTGSFGNVIPIADTATDGPHTWNVNVPAHVHANWAFTEQGTYRMHVQASGTLSGGATVQSPVAEYVMHVGDLADYVEPADPVDPVETTLTIEGLAHHYHTGEAIELTAVQDPQTDLDHYHWFTRSPSEDDWAVVSGALSGSVTMTAGEAPALDGTEVIARLYDDDHNAVAESDPVTISIDDHDDHEPTDPVETTLTIEGLAHHYHTGEAIELTAVQDPQTDLDHYHWFTRSPSEDDWAVVSGALSGSVTMTAGEAPALDGTEVIARLYDDDHNAVAESDPVTISIDDHDDHEPTDPVETTLTIEGLRHHYHTGDTARLTAVQDPTTDLDHYHWFVTPAGGAQAIVPGVGGDTYEFTVTADWDGAQIIARLYDDDHDVVAESDPVTIRVDDHDDHDDPTPPPFRDVDPRNPHAEAIAELVERGITKGTAPDLFSPTRSVTRAQLASFVARALDLPDVATTFRDVPARYEHAGAIGAMVEAGYVQGFSDGTFRPNAAITRDQVAGILGRVLALDGHRQDRFSDIAGSTHREMINALADIDVARGSVDGRYQPRRDLQRDQMASLLIRALHHQEG
jgi:surface-anchored protein